MRVYHDFIWSTLVHFGTNFWHDFDNTVCDHSKLYHTPASHTLRFDREMWDEYLMKLKESGCNAIVVDLGDSMVYDSHPELAVEGAYTKDEMRLELDRLASLGFEVIPKLNFSTTHDVWLGEYARMVSTPTYYKVCCDLIDETVELFRPRYFHIGFDEEDYANQSKYDYVVIRQNELWWHDLKLLARRVEDGGARALIWADYARHRPDEFVEKLPKSVIPVNWYYFVEYGENISEEMRIRVAPFDILEEHGFDQIPGGSVEYHQNNLELLATYCKEHISKEHLFGFIQTTWCSVERQNKEHLWNGADAVAEAIKAFEGQQS